MAEPSFPPYNVGDLGAGVRRQAPAAARTVGPIGDVLAGWLPASGLVLEIASGTGEHALAFSSRFPNLDWQPSDPDTEALASIRAWRENPLCTVEQADSRLPWTDVHHVDAQDRIRLVDRPFVSTGVDQQWGTQVWRAALSPGSDRG